MFKITPLTTAACILICFSTFAQKKFDLAAIANEKKLTVLNRALEITAQTKSVKLDERSGQGFAKLTDVSFTTGIIEIDLKGKDVPQQSFVGVAFHMHNDSTFEAIYFRPFNFHATDPIRKIHAVQYICHPQFGWEKLRTERNGEFEKGIDNAPDPNGWFHAKIEVTAQDVLVYVNNSTTPSLKVTRLRTDNTGGVALWTGEGSGGEFKNLEITGR